MRRRFENIYEEQRYRMVEEQLANRGIKDRRVLEVMKDVPRHLFLPEELRSQAYDDRPLPLGPEQTISQPLVVAEMLELLDISPEQRILEVGTGSGYVSGLLANLCSEVYTIEIDELLFKWSSIRFRELGLDNVKARLGNGYEGWPEAAPFDRILMSAATPRVPDELLSQLKVPGKIVLPLGRESQRLVLIEKTDQGMSRRYFEGVRFVMMQDNR